MTAATTPFAIQATMSITFNAARRSLFASREGAPPARSSPVSFLIQQSRELTALLKFQYRYVHESKVVCCFSFPHPPHYGVCSFLSVANPTYQKEPSSSHQMQPRSVDAAAFGVEIQMAKIAKR